MEEQEDKRGFKVQDRRRFSPETGEARETEETVRSTEGSTQAAAAAAAEQAEGPHHEQIRGNRPTAASSVISFSSFILGLSTQALMYMGEIPSAPGQPVHTDFAAAQQMIDVLAMLKQKTNGNLDAGESAMLDNALFDLRMHYVDMVKKGTPTPQGSK